MEVSRAGLALIQRFEGLRLEAYLDSVGKPTIGYGSTQGVRMGDEITNAQATELLAADVERHADGVRRLVDVPLSQNMFDALVSFTFNVGVGALSRSTLLRRLNAGDYQGAAQEFARWVYAGGKQLDGLKRRRETERSLFLEPVSPDMPESWFDEVDRGHGGPR